MPSHKSNWRMRNVRRGAFAAADTDRRLDEHFEGRVHVGFQKIRDAVKKHLEYIAHAPLPDQALSKILME